jgi:hypothetical protein
MGVIGRHWTGDTGAAKGLITSHVPKEPKGNGRPQSLECLRIHGEGMSTMPGD